MAEKPSAEERESELLGAFVDHLTAPIEYITDVVFSALPDLSDLLPDEVEKTITDIGSKFEDVVGGAISRALSGLISIIIVYLQESTEATGLLFGTFQNWIELGKQEANISTPTGLVEGPLMAPLVFRGLITFPEYIEQMQKRGFTEDRAAAILRAMRPSLSVADVITAKVRKIIPEERTRSELERIGYDAADQSIIEKFGEALPDVTTLMFNWLRGNLTDSEFGGYLERHGFSERSIQIIKDEAYPIPPVQDIVTMSGKEAFEDDQAQLLGLDDEFPAKFAEFAKQKGLTEEWAKFYWRAHWALPSITQGYEMLHRRVITQEELDGLFRAHEITPAWREKLTRISFSPLTRVDVRRMFAIGVLSREEVVNAYLDDGYNEENAERLATFVEQDTLRSTLSTTRARLLTLFRLGIVSEGKLREFFSAMGMPSDQLDILIAEQLFLAGEESVNRQMRAVRSQFVNRVIDTTIAIGKLSALGLSAVGIENTIAEWIESREASVNRITLRNLQKAFEKGLITESRYRVELSERKMPEDDIDIMIRLAQPPPPPA